MLKESTERTVWLRGVTGGRPELWGLSPSQPITTRRVRDRGAHTEKGSRLGGKNAIMKDTDVSEIS